MNIPTQKQREKTPLGWSEPCRYNMKQKHAHKRRERESGSKEEEGGGEER